MIRRPLALALLVVTVACARAAATTGTTSQLAAMACRATPVHGNLVKAGPFTGHMVPEHDVVGGRFSLRVGGYRTETLTSKIPWYVPFRYKVGDSVVITGRRLHPSARSFRQEEARALTAGNQGWVFPSIIDPPSTGCWRLTFRSGNASGTLTVFVRSRAS
jgi:hypothetical protein